jgi:hypothetical protein
MAPAARIGRLTDHFLSRPSGVARASACSVGFSRRVLQGGLSSLQPPFAAAFPCSCNITEAEERAFKDLAKITFAFSDAALARLLEDETYKEVICNG